MPGVKHIISAAIIVLVIAGALFFLRSTDTKPNRMSCATEKTTIAVFGDSLVAGYGATKGNDFPSLLSKQLGAPVQNFGRNGETTSSALDRTNQVLQANPDIVVVLLGGNDALQRFPVSTTKQNLGTIIDTFQKAGMKVVLVGVAGGFGSDPFKPMYEELAKTHTVTLVPNILKGLLGNNSFMSDQIHPNDAGYAKIADRLVPVLEGTCE
ncbi:MAG: acyl-CoA thioesterase I [Parcubacteria bacterium C7867-007]|nr:MAG: acyl-CoA thioesterase I [Parcubacteria bacterium C7867-007]